MIAAAGMDGDRGHGCLVLGAWCLVLDESLSGLWADDLFPFLHLVCCVAVRQMRRLEEASGN